MKRVAVTIMFGAAACMAPVAPQAPAPLPTAGDRAEVPIPETPPAAPSIRWSRIETAADLPPAPPTTGTWRIHLIDVGTGLSILVQGADFSLLYDAGSGDPGEQPLRVVAYLAAVLGSSGPVGDGGDLCVAKGEAVPTSRRTIDHVVMSHPHLDHGSALDTVLHCFGARSIWDSGRVNDAVFYRDFISAVARSTGATYHTAAAVPAARSIRIKGEDIAIPSEVGWDSFSEGDVIELGDRARFTILHAEAKAHADPNENTVVLALELGGARVLLTGDAESGPRADPSAPVDHLEEYLLTHFAKIVDVDILQVGHHGSKTSSRRAFLEAVSPTLALVSSGPKKYRGTRLPDAEVIEALGAIGATVLRTDERDEDCPVHGRIGGDTGPGGCDSWLISIE